MARKWYEDLKNVFELAEFMVESEQIESAKELLEYFKHPEKYEEVWKLYQEEILGKIESSHRSNPDTKTPFPVIFALTNTK